jgi:HlyD family secretion protein
VLDREKQARTVNVEVEFIKPEDIKSLLAGYSADIEIVLNVHKDTIRIPTQAVLNNERVFVYLRETNKIESRFITIGISNWDYTEVTKGLKEDEQVVISIDREGIKDGAYAVLAKEGS